MRIIYHRRLIWDNPQIIHTIGDSIVSTEGSFVIGKNGTRTVPGSVTVNGVTFTNANSFASSAGGIGYNGTDVYQLGGISADFETMMDSFVYECYSIDLLSLTLGKKYLIQLFISDDRDSVIFKNRKQYYTINGLSSKKTANYPAYSIIGRFIATDINMICTIVGSGNICNGFQLRELD